MEHIYSGFFEFTGFSKQKGRCHIFVCRNGNSINVICTQIPSYTGTSISNAFEVIYKEFKTKFIEHKKSVVDDIVSGLSDKDAHIKGLTKWLFGYFSHKITKAIMSIIGVKLKSNIKINWIEHWPSYIDGSNAFLVVEHIEGSDPVWKGRISTDELFLRYGIPSEVPSILVKKFPSENNTKQT